LTGFASQPIPFSHKRHAALKVECAYCHQKAATAERAGFPAASKCMVCHREVAKDAEAIERLATLAPDAAIVPEKPLYTLPDFVFFSHARHKEKVGCATCHGNVWAGDAVKLHLSMKMKACVDCHKASHATETCTACHELSQ